MGQGEALLCRPRLRAGDGHRRRLHLPREVLRASRRSGHHHRQREVPCPRGPLPAFLPRYGVLRCPRDHLQLHHEVRCWHQEGPVRQHRHVRWHHHVPRYRRQDAEGDHRPCSLHHQYQDHRSPREEVLRLSVAPSCLPSPPSSRCGSPSRSTTSAAHPLSTGSASKFFHTFNLLNFLSFHPVILCNLLEDLFECSPLE